MTLMKKPHEFASGQELIGYLHQEKKPLSGSTIVYDYEEYDHPVAEDEITGEFILTLDPKTGEEVAVFNPDKVFSSEHMARIISPDIVAVDGFIGYVRSRKLLTKK